MGSRPRLERRVGRAERTAAEEALARRQRRGVHALEHHVPLAVDELFLLLRVAAPPEEHHRLRLRVHRSNHRVREGLPPVPRVAVGLPPPHRQHRVEQQPPLRPRHQRGSNRHGPPGARPGGAVGQPRPLQPRPRPPLSSGEEAGTGGGEPSLCRDGEGAEQGAHAALGLGRAATQDVCVRCVRLLRLWRPPPAAPPETGGPPARRWH